MYLRCQSMTPSSLFIEIFPEVCSCWSSRGHFSSYFHSHLATLQVLTERGSLDRDIFFTIVLDALAGKCRVLADQVIGIIPASCWQNVSNAPSFPGFSGSCKYHPGHPGFSSSKTMPSAEALTLSLQCYLSCGTKIIGSAMMTLQGVVYFSIKITFLILYRRSINKHVLSYP